MMTQSIFCKDLLVDFLTMSAYATFVIGFMDAKYSQETVVTEMMTTLENAVLCERNDC